MRTVPVVLVTGVAEEPMASTTMGLQWDLPQAVVVQHRIDATRQVLVRTVTDIGGVVEREEIDLEHACVSCAIREDIVPSLERLAADGRWGAIIAHLPVTAEATQVCRVIAWEPARTRHIRVAAVVAALDADDAVEDLLGDDLVADRGLSTSIGDARGVGEVATAMVEYADVVTLLGSPEQCAQDLVRAIARPLTAIVHDAALLDTALMIRGIHEHPAAERWVADVRHEPLPPLHESTAWRLDLRADRPFHPERLHRNVERIGGGPRRSRGCFWLASRPDAVGVWDGAGGQLSIGADERWEHTSPMTRIVVVGLDDGFEEIDAAFRDCLLSDAELRTRGPYWEVARDGLEPWLGPIARAA